MNHDKGAHCLCVAEHRPAVLEHEHHHIWPREYGGPNIPANLVWICPTTHTNTHEILRELIRRNGALTWAEALTLWEVPLSRYAYALAVEGYRRLTTKEIPSVP